MKQVVVFDFDGTITRRDSFIGFSRFALGRAKVLKALTLSLPKILLWKLGIVSSSKAKECLFGHLYAGQHVAALMDCAQGYEPPLRREVMDKLQEHLRQGDTVYIISASFSLWIAPWAKKHGVENICCTGAAVDRQGNLTGRFSTPNCRGEEKVRRLLQMEPDRKSYHLTAYGDSRGDREMLQFADTAYKL